MKPVVNVQDKNLTVYDRKYCYKYLGKSLSLSGEDNTQIFEFIEQYHQLISQIAKCKLPLALKASAFNNMALANILHHFYNTRLTVEQLDELDVYLTKVVRNLYGLYHSTTRLIIYLPHELGGIGIKRVSDVYITTRLAFLVKMLNHNIVQFQNVARNSLKLDMSKRGVRETVNLNNFLGYELTNDRKFLNSKTVFGCQSDWPDMLRYSRKLNVDVIFEGGEVCIRSGEKIFHDSDKLQKRLFKLCVDRDVVKAKSLGIQGPFLGISGVQLKSSHSLFYNWEISDQLVVFGIKARLSLLPTNFTTYIWNRDNNPMCPFCRRHTESVAHMMNGCSEFRNYYSKRHNRIGNKIAQEIRNTRIRWRVYEDKLFESIFPEYDDVRHLKHRKIDIVVVESV